MQTSVLNADVDLKFFGAVHDRTTNKNVKEALSACMLRQVDHVIPLMQATRHVFIHGDLAPGANSARPGVAQKLAKVGCPLFLKSIQRDFDARVAVGLSSI